MTLTVSEITQAIKISIESTFPNVSIQGEISNCKLQSSGHLYFSLKDTSAQIGAVMFRSHASVLKKVPKDGDEVILKGDLNVYPPSGRYQIVARDLQYAGVGELLLKLEELKRKLHGMGWFKEEHKKPLPLVPKTIGVVTSPTGAAIKDMLNVLTRRHGGFHLILNPVRVQGAEAPQEIADAIKEFDRLGNVDVLIVGRGGGSIEDLWAFNDERVAEAIFHCKIPIICAVGHETDHCIAEYVSDVRAPTPSAAAELVMQEKEQLFGFLTQTEETLRTHLLHKIAQYHQKLTAILKQPVFISPYNLLSRDIQRLDELKTGIDTSIRQKIREHILILEGHKKRLETLKPTVKIAQYRQKLLYLQKALASIDPKNLLKSGYSILFSEKDGSVITSVEELQPGYTVKTLFADGVATSTITEVFPNECKKGT